MKVNSHAGDKKLTKSRRKARKPKRKHMSVITKGLNSPEDMCSDSTLDKTPDRSSKTTFMYNSWIIDSLESILLEME